MDKVKEGWIIFMDDDAMFAKRDALEKINETINSNNDMLFWKVKLGRHIIYSSNINDIKVNHIDSCGFCFHSTYKNYSRWPDKRAGDFAFISNLLKKVQFNRHGINDILTKSTHNLIGLQGLKEYYKLGDFLREQKITQNLIYRI